MAAENQDQVPQNAIPPKAVPPTAPKAPADAGADSATVRRAAMPTGAGGPLPPGVTPSTAPRTVRLKPVQVPPTGAAMPTGVAQAAAEAIKRMTSRIPMPAAEGGKSGTAPIPTAVPSGAAAVPGAKRMTGQIPVIGAVVETDASGVKKVTSRLAMPGAPGSVPAVADVPKTIKIRPLSGTQPVTGTQPVADAAPSAAAPQAAKSKTSRIPLEAAMGIPQTSESSAPKTIKLKRPGDMSTVRVQVSGGGQAPEGEAGTITQKKTIRVKRPLAPAMPAAGGEGVVPSATFQAPVVVSEGRETGAGPFVAVAALVIVVVFGLLVVFSSEIFGPNASLTQLSVKTVVDFALPGKVQPAG